MPCLAGSRDRSVAIGEARMPQAGRAQGPAPTMVVDVPVKRVWDRHEALEFAARHSLRRSACGTGVAGGKWFHGWEAMGLHQVLIDPLAAQPLLNLRLNHRTKWFAEALGTGILARASRLIRLGPGDRVRGWF